MFKICVYRPECQKLKLFKCLYIIEFINIFFFFFCYIVILPHIYLMVDLLNKSSLTKNNINRNTRSDRDTNSVV